MNTFRDKISWRVTGFNTQDAAEKALEAEVAWFNRTFNANEWTITTSIQGTPYGWAAEYNDNKESAE